MGDGLIWFSIVGILIGIALIAAWAAWAAWGQEK